MDLNKLIICTNHSDYICLALQSRCKIENSQWTNHIVSINQVNTNQSFKNVETIKNHVVVFIMQIKSCMQRKFIIDVNQMQLKLKNLTQSVPFNLYNF